jgi:polyribonucleotide nucleotidyltransferase
VLSADMVTPHDILCINGASAALMISPLPFFGPVGAVRIGNFDYAHPCLDTTDPNAFQNRNRYHVHARRR